MSTFGEPFAINPPGFSARPSSLQNGLTVAPAGVCRFCHCTEFHACEGGCAWLDREATVCDHPECRKRFEQASRELGTAFSTTSPELLKSGKQGGGR